MGLAEITALSHQFGSDKNYVLAGGGNTSFKDEEFLYVKPSGVRLAAIAESDFVKMERAVVRECFALGEFADAKLREDKVKKLMAFAVAAGSSGRPSVEAPLHELMEFRYVVHLHPAAVNGMTCGADGKAICAKLFPAALWVDYVDPGYTLAKHVFDAAKAYKAAKGRAVALIFLQNHGVFVGGDTPAEIENIYAEVMSVLQQHYASCGLAAEATGADDDGDATPDMATVMALAPELRGRLAADGKLMAVTAGGAFPIAAGPLTPDHIVYAKSFGLTSDNPDAAAIAAFEAAHGYKPLVVAVPGKAVFAAGASYNDAMTVMALARDAHRVEALTAACGGAHYIDDRGRGFIENWEVESYRKSVGAATAAGAGAMANRIAVVTGGAQGFGFGIAEALVAAGATVAIADMNLAGAEAAAARLNGDSGKHRAFAVAVNIADEASVEAMLQCVVKTAGGLDVFVANAGVLKAGSVKTLAKKDWDFVTNINYSGYFLCVKHAAPVMARQNAVSGLWSDIVQVNSKSGLVGSNKNGAYAGSKFGTIGLTQSFALELVADQIKVNSICPGNFFDGPLWSDPERGLFVQYLNSGKVPGARDVADVKRHYEAQIPMRRGCLPSDVARAIVYVVNQAYETGQAVPVTGGQVMLN